MAFFRIGARTSFKISASRSHINLLYSSFYLRLNKLVAYQVFVFGQVIYSIAFLLKELEEGITQW